MMKKPWLGYTLYGVVLTLLFLYGLFPSTLLERWLESVVAERYGIYLTVESAELTMPPGVRLEGSRFSFPERLDAVILLHSLSVRPKAGGLLKGKPVFAIRCEGYGGRMDGTVSFAKRFTLSEAMNFRGVVKDFDLGGAVFLANLLGRRIEGALGAIIEFSGGPANPMDGSGRIELSLARGRYHFQEAFMGLEKIEFDQVEMTADIEGRVVSVNEIRLAGSGVEGTVKGTVHLHPDLKQSRIDLRGNASVPSLERPASVIVGGTLANPTIRVGRS